MPLIVRHGLSFQHRRNGEPEKPMKHYLFLCLAILGGCRPDTAVTCTDATALHAEADFRIGVAVDVGELFGNPVYEAIARKQFNSLTPENVMKVAYLQPQEGVFDFRDADSLLAYSLRNGQRLHGHTLVWHQQLPAWMEVFEGDAAAWDQLLKTHIQTIVGRYKNDIRSWDVVNEAFLEDGSLRNSLWLQKLGPAYIEKAFRYAHEAAPDALLFYNDYNLESNPTKLRSVLSILNGLRSRGIRVDGIGLQMHVSTAYPEPAQIGTALQEVAAQQYHVHVSELDVSVNPFGRDLELSPKLLAQQADLLGAIVFHYRQIPSQLQFGITLWGVSDRNSWIRYFYQRADYPLLYDDDYRPKSAYCKMKEML